MNKKADVKSSVLDADGDDLFAEPKTEVCFGLFIPYVECEIILYSWFVIVCEYRVRSHRHQQIKNTIQLFGASLKERVL